MNRPMLSIKVDKLERTQSDIDILVSILVDNGYVVKKAYDDNEMVNFFVYELTTGELDNARYRKIRTDAGDNDENSGEYF